MKILNQYSKTFNAADLTQAGVYTPAYPLISDPTKAVYVQVYVSTEDLDNGAYTDQTIAIAPYVVKDHTRDPSVNDKRNNHKIMTVGDATDGAFTQDVVTAGAEADIEKLYLLGMNQHDHRVYANAIAFKLSNAVATTHPWAGGTVTLEIIVAE